MEEHVLGFSNRYLFGHFKQKHFDKFEMNIRHLPKMGVHFISVAVRK